MEFLKGGWNDRTQFQIHEVCAALHCSINEIKCTPSIPELLLRLVQSSGGLTRRLLFTQKERNTGEHVPQKFQITVIVRHRPQLKKVAQQFVCKTSVTSRYLLVSNAELSSRPDS